MGTPDVNNLISDRGELAQLFGSTPNLIGEIPIDVLVSETPRYESEITQRPLEAGFEATDARIARPTSVSLECILTDTPTDFISLASQALSGKWSLQGWREKYAELMELNRTNATIDVTTPLDTYSGYMISSLSIDRRSSTGGALFFTCEIVQVRFVATDISQVDESAIPKEKREEQKTKKRKTDPDKNKGKKQTKEAPASSDSILLKLGKAADIFQ
jgi:hypothetical protein